MRPMELEIIYHDDDYIVINKPSGLLVHRSPIDRHETRFAMQLLRDQIGQRVYPVHRLDKPTSGLLVFALHSEAANALQQQFIHGELDKYYLAVVRGYTPQQLTIDHPVKAVQDKKHQGRVTDAKPALTHLQTLAQCELDVCIEKYPKSRYSLVALHPVTGRRHQLRYHMKHISHPIIGDPKYGKSKHNHYFTEAFANTRLLLTAVKLAFTHPYSQQAIRLTARPTEDFCQTIEQLGWSEDLTLFLGD